MKRILCIILAASVLASVTALAAGGSPLRQAARRLLEKGPAYQASEWAEKELAQAEEAALIPAALENSDLTKPITRQEYAAAAVALYDQLLALNPGAVVMEREAHYPVGRQGPFTDVNDPDGLRADAAHARALGFTGKASISPRHVEDINAAFSPSEAEVRYAQEVLLTIEEGRRMGKGAVSLRGKMIDKPIVDRARQTLETARALGMEVEG